MTEFILLLFGSLSAVVGFAIFISFAKEYTQMLQKLSQTELDPATHRFKNGFCTKCHGYEYGQPAVCRNEFDVPRRSNIKPHDDRLVEEDERGYWECLACGRRVAFFARKVNDCPGGDHFGAYKAMEEQYN